MLSWPRKQFFLARFFLPTPEILLGFWSPVLFPVQWFPRADGGSECLPPLISNLLAGPKLEMQWWQAPGHRRAGILQTGYNPSLPAAPRRDKSVLSVPSAGAKLVSRYERRSAATQQNIITLSLSRRRVAPAVRLGVEIRRGTRLRAGSGDATWHRSRRAFTNRHLRPPLRGLGAGAV